MTLRGVGRAGIGQSPGARPLLPVVARQSTTRPTSRSRASTVSDHSRGAAANAPRRVTPGTSHHWRGIMPRGRSGAPARFGDNPRLSVFPAGRSPGRARVVAAGGVKL